MRILPLQCKFDVDFVSELIFATLAPLMCLVVLFFIMRGHIWQRKRTLLKSYNENVVSSNIEQKWKKMNQEVRLLYLNFVLIVSFTILPSVTTTIFSMFLCEDIDPNDDNPDLPKYYLTVDKSIECYSDRYNMGLIIAILMIFVYPIGIPLNYFSTLYRNRYGIMNRPDDKIDFLSRLRSLSFLFVYYKPEFWYFEVVETARRISLTAVLSVTFPGSGSQVVFAIILSLIFKEIYSKLDPYADKKMAFTAELTSIQVFLTFFTVLVIEKSLLGVYIHHNIIYFQKLRDKFHHTCIYICAHALARVCVSRIKNSTMLYLFWTLPTSFRFHIQGLV